MLERPRKVNYNLPRPPLRIRSVRTRLEMGRRVTVCIAAIALDGRRPSDARLVTISDTMLEGDLSSDESAVKTEMFHEDWASFVAGDVTTLVPIIDEAKACFTGQPNTLKNARDSFKSAWKKHVVQIAEDRVLGRFGLSMEEYLKTGKLRFTEEVFNSLATEIRQVDLGADFLVYGFDGEKRPHVFHVARDGTDAVYDKPGFAAIGSGANAAHTVLWYLGQNIDRTEAETIYNVCAAKYMAERASGVGRKTFLFVKTQGRGFFVTKTGMEERIREAWEKSGKLRVPDGVVKMIEDDLK